MSDIASRFSRSVIAWRWLIILASVAAIAAAAAGVRTLHFDGSYRIYFGPDNPQRIAFEAIENTYTQNDNAMIVIAPADGDVFTPDTLALVEWATERAWQMPHSSRVDSITNFQLMAAAGDDLVVRNLVADARSLSPAELDRVRRTAMAEPLLRDRLVAADGAVTAINIHLQMPGSDETGENQQVVAFARALAAAIEDRAPGIATYITGMVIMNHSFFEQSVHDLSFIFPLSIVVMMVLLGICVGGIIGTAVTLLVIAFSVACAMGAAGYLELPISPPVASAPSIILTIAIANCVHLLTTFRQGMRSGRERLDALRESLRVNLQPVFLASTTTAIGFLTLNFSEVPPFQHLGTVVAVGVITALVLSLTLLPALLAVLPIAAPRASWTGDRAMVALGEFVVRRRRPLFVVMATLILGLVANVPRNTLNDVFLHYFDETIEFRADSDFTVANLTGLYTIEYSLPAAESGGINEPEFLAQAARFGDWLRAQSGVRHVTVLTDVLKRLNKNMHGDDPGMYRLPESRALAAQYLLLFEMSLPYGLDLNNQVNVDKSSIRVTAATDTLSSSEVIALTSRAEAWLRDNAPAIGPTEGTGATVMFANIGQRNIRAMLLASVLAFVLISAILMVALRSLRIGLVSLVPNLVPAAMGFGLWGLYVGEVGLALSVVTSMTLGVIVDDTVHFLSKYLRARRELGADAADAVRYAFRTVGHAMSITSVVLIAGFTVLATSHFELNAGMGLLTAIVIFFALAADFLFLPPLLMMIEGENDATRDRALTRSSAAV